MSRQITCPTCHGNGWTVGDGSDGPCPTCGGRSEKKFFGGTRSVDGKGYVTVKDETKKCSHCNGTGSCMKDVNLYPEYRQGPNMQRRTCNYCSGSGIDTSSSNLK